MNYIDTVQCREQCRNSPEKCCTNIPKERDKFAEHEFEVIEIQNKHILETGKYFWIILDLMNHLYPLDEKVHGLKTSREIPIPKFIRHANIVN